MDLRLELPRFFTGKHMKLPLILAFLVAYVVLATIWICYAQLVALY